MSEGRTIFCFKCDLRLGVVRDASLRKGMGHICGSCMDKVKHPPLVNPELADIFKGAFNR